VRTITTFLATVFFLSSCVQSGPSQDERLKVYKDSVSTYEINLNRVADSLIDFEKNQKRLEYSDLVWSLSESWYKGDKSSFIDSLSTSRVFRLINYFKTGEEEVYGNVESYDSLLIGPKDTSSIYEKYHINTNVRNLYLSHMVKWDVQWMTMYKGADWLVDNSLSIDVKKYSKSWLKDYDKDSISWAQNIFLYFKKQHPNDLLFPDDLSFGETNFIDWYSRVTEPDSVLIGKYLSKEERLELQKKEIATVELYATGTGFVISDDGYIVTNNHVVEDGKRFIIKNLGNTKSRVAAKVVLSDPNNDLAVLKIDSMATNLKSVYITASKAKIGSKAFAMGYPMVASLGSSVKFNDGTISSMSGFENNISRYQISTPVQPGNSGGPCFNEKGEVIGVIVGGIDVKYAENVGYAIKSSYLLNTLSSSTLDLSLHSKNPLRRMDIDDVIKHFSECTVLIEVSK
jgi:S1-C subfamily serine protease